MRTFSLLAILNYVISIAEKIIYFIFLTETKED